MTLKASGGSETSHEERQVVIVALMLAPTLGDFIEYNLFAASFKRLYRNARLIAYYRRDRPFKDAVVEMNPEVDEIWPQEGTETVEAGLFDPSRGDGGGRHVDVVLTPSMMSRTTLPSLPSLARFRIAEDIEESFRAEFTSAGLDPERWFCVLHYREPSYDTRGENADRDIDAGDPIAMTRFIIDTLGGQVVRIGHAEMTPFPEFPGFLDLSRHPGGIKIHAAAVRRARFFLELSPSGPAALAPCFGVPLARCNALIIAGPTSPDSVVLNQHLFGPDGIRVPIKTCVEKNLLDGTVMHTILRERGYQFRRNTLSEMKRIAEEITASTRDCPGWREPAEPARASPSDQVPWPIVPSRAHRIWGYGAAASAAREP
jgi:putative glycosyltransferase (TIGR04372 family)